MVRQVGEKLSHILTDRSLVGSTSCPPAHVNRALFSGPLGWKLPGVVVWDDLHGKVTQSWGCISVARGIFEYCLEYTKGRSVLGV